MAVKFSEFTIETIPGNVSYLVGYSGSSNIRIAPGNLLSGVIPYTGASLDVNLGAFGITASQFIKSDGTSSQFLKADGSIDSNTYLTAASGYVPYTGSTSDLDLGTHSITATTIIKVGGTSIQYLMADGSISSGPSFAGYVPYTGATGNVYLGSNTISTDGFILYGGTNEQFLKADGSVDNNMYLTQNDLPSTLILYATNVPSGINGYFKLVTTIGNPDYNTVPVNIPTGDITTTNQFIAGLITIPNLINGNPGVFNITTVGNIRKAVGSGSGQATFFYRIYKRNSLGIESLVCTSDPTLPVNNGTYAEFQATGLFNDGIFEPTDTIVVKYYANRISGGSDPAYEFQFGGDTPVRTLVPIPTSAIPNISLYQLIDVDANTPAENDGLFYDVSVSLWKNKSISTVLGYTPVTSARTLTINGTTYDLSANRSWSVGTVTSVGASSPLSSTGGDAPTISISQVNGLDDGYLSAADYNTFSGKQNALTIGNITSTTTDIGITGGISAIIGSGVALTLSNTGVTAGAYGNGVTIPNITVDAKGRVTLLSTTAIPTAGVLLTGLLTAADWNTFYNKQNPITLTTTGNSGAATFIGGTLNIPQYTLAGLGGTPTTRTLTINGVTYDLSADRTWSIADTGITSLNGLTALSQTFSVGTTGTDFNISSAISTHTFNLPTASATNRGALSSANWTTFNNKQDAIIGAATTITSSDLTALRVLVSDASGKVSANTVTTTTLSYLDATSSIQTQLNGKAIVSGIPTSGQIAFFNGTTNTITANSSFSWDNTLKKLVINSSSISSYNSGGIANDSLKVVSSNLGAGFAVQNLNFSGYSGIEYLSYMGTVAVFTGFNNSNGQEFRFNNIITGGYINFFIGGTSAFRINNNRNILINQSIDDLTNKLQVTGGTKLTGNLSVTTLSTGYLPKAGTSGLLGNSAVYQNVNNIYIGATSSFTGNNAKLEVTGTIGLSSLTTGSVGCFPYAHGVQGFLDKSNLFYIESENLLINNNGVSQTVNSALEIFAGGTECNLSLISDNNGYHLLDGYLGSSGNLTIYIEESGDIYNSNGAYYGYSDIRIKENITSATSKLDDLMKVNIVNYNLIKDENKVKQIGVVAQELEKIFPSLVGESKEGIKSVKHSVFIPILIKAVQEQQAQIEELKQLINK